MLIEHTKTKPEETLDFLDEQMQNFLFNRSINLSEEGKWLLAVRSLESTTSVFDITDENNSISNIIPGHYQTESA